MRLLDQKINNSNSLIASRLQTLNDYSLDFVVKWMVEREGISELDAKQGRDEFVEFVSLAILTEDLISEKPLVASEKADEFWHSFLLFNSKYNDWSNQIFGKLLIHNPGLANQENWILTQNAIKEEYGKSIQFPGTSSASFTDIDSLFGNGIW